jgi:hypothetical protein
LISAIWRYAAAALLVGLATAAIIRGTPFWDIPSGTSAALRAIIVVSMLFLTLYLGTVILFHWGLAPLRQLASLLRELAPSRKSARPAAEACGRDTNEPAGDPPTESRGAGHLASARGKTYPPVTVIGATSPDGSGGFIPFGTPDPQ